MDLTSLSALSGYTYLTALSRTGSAGQALGQALAAGSAQATALGPLLAGAGSADGMPAPAGGATPDLAALSYASAEAAGAGAERLRTLLAGLGGRLSPLLTGADALPVPAAALSANTTAALVRYTYDQTQDPAAAFAQASLGSTLNLFA